ncbi:MAG: hypothetical protein JW751_08805 [Polyangiaceae bacterium]|nr:hypothetical protein [Polyangiaceae bacterium]
MDFRTKLIETLRAIQTVLDQPGVLVVGSEVPNLLEAAAACSLVVSQDVDIGVPIASHVGVKGCLRRVQGLRPSAEEPSVWVPEREALIEVNFIGIDPDLRDLTESYVYDDPELPMLVFGAVSAMRHGRTVEVDGVRVPLPRMQDLLLEKLISERSGIKGDRDLLVVAGLLLVAEEAALTDLEATILRLPGELRHAVRTNLAVLSLLGSVPGMPDPNAVRAVVATLLRRLDLEGERP